MVASDSKHTGLKFNEVAIADLGHFQIAVPTLAKSVKQPRRSALLPQPKRIYHSQGYLIWNHGLIASLKAIDIGSLSVESSPFKSVQRLAPAIPVSFEAESTAPLPDDVLAQAVFTYQWSNSNTPYQAVFRHTLPRFVRIYPFQGVASLVEQATQMQMDEALFVVENHERLRQIPFYKASFDL